MSDSARSTLARWTALEAERLADGSPRFAFRGASRPREGLVSPLARLADRDEALARAAHAVCRRCKDVACHVYEFAHDPLEALASLACHGWPTPFVGFSSRAATAFAFALRRGAGRGCLIRIDRARLPERVRACTADFLGLGRKEDEPLPNWLRQQGLALIDQEWRRFETAADFDLKAPDCVEAVTEVVLELDGLELDVEALAGAPGLSLDPLREPIERVGRKVLGPGGVGTLGRLLAPS